LVSEGKQTTGNRASSGHLKSTARCPSPLKRPAKNTLAHASGFQDADARVPLLLVLRASLRIKRRGGSWVAHAYSYDDNDRVTRYENLIPTGNWDDAVDYTYDDTNQLVEEDTWNSYQDNAYEYDLAGNRTEKDGTAQTVVAGNRVTDDGTYTYAYDEEGNLIKRTTTASGNERQLIYDFRNRLIEVKDFTGTIAGGTLKTDVKYEYDTLNRRVHTWLDTNGDGSSDREEFYIYDGDDVVLDFVDANVATGGVSPVVAMRYLHGPAVDQLLAQEDLGKSTSADDRTLWMLTDLLGSTRDIADNAGNGVSHISYDAFGNVPSNIVLLTRYLWTGREFEITTGLQYNRNRWYDATLGRWISEDPIGFNSGDYNLGRYVVNEPTSWIDPFGLEQYGPGGSAIGTVYAGFAGIGQFLTSPLRLIPGTGDYWARQDAALQDLYDRSGIGRTVWQDLSEYGSAGAGILISAGLSSPTNLAKKPLEELKCATNKLPWDKLWGSGADDAAAALERLRRGERILPKEIGPRALDSYEEIARRAMANPNKASEVQKLRQQILKELRERGYR
jgi:RHS repeat-associated protein